MKARPQYILENHEDEIYHEQRLDKLTTEPEYYAFVNKVLVFNRAMEWIETDAGNILCYSKGGDLPLTGSKQVSKWYSDPLNKIESEIEFSSFEKCSERNRDCAVLPAFQFNILQHPGLELTVKEANADWQFCIFIKGRSGSPLLCSGWKTEPAVSMKFNIREALEQKGYNLQFAELHFAVGTWTSDKKRPSRIKFKMSLVSEATIIPSLPVIRSKKTLREKEAFISTVVLDESGHLCDKSNVKVCAFLGNEKIPMSEGNKLWTASLPELPCGEYDIKLQAMGKVNKDSSVHVRITDGNFFSYSKKHKSLVLNKHIMGPMSGSYQGMALFGGENAGKKMLNGQDAWDELTGGAEPREHWHYWEALTEEELDERFSFLANSGWTLLHLSQHAGIWERLDAGGRISPHGAEQLGLYLRLASRHGMAVLQALTHYPYAVDSLDCEDNELSGTPPFSRYIEEFSFKNDDWTRPESNFTAAFHCYLRHYAMLFNEETAIFALSASGEGDIKAGPDRVNSTHKFMKSVDKNHLFLSEPIHRMKKLPSSHCKGWKQELFGSRTYWIGEKIKPDTDLGIEYKLMQLGHIFMGEGCWPCWPLYAEFQNKVGGRYATDDTWAGSERYRSRVRDTIYLGLVHRSPIILTWDEQTTEDERFIFEKIRHSVDWGQSFLEPQIAVRVNACNVLDEGRAALAEYEKFFSSVPLNYKLISPDSSLKDNDFATLDATGLECPDLAFSSDGGTLPDSLKEEIPFAITGNYRVSFLWSSDRRTLIAYVYNSAGYACSPQKLAGNIHRVPVPTELSLQFLNLPEDKLNYTLYDLNKKQPIKTGMVKKNDNIDLGVTQKDYLLFTR